MDYNTISIRNAIEFSPITLNIYINLIKINDNVKI